jgi:hypothetical protein
MYQGQNLLFEAGGYNILRTPSMFTPYSTRPHKLHALDAKQGHIHTMHDAADCHDNCNSTAGRLVLPRATSHQLRFMNMHGTLAPPDHHQNVG